MPGNESKLISECLNDDSTDEDSLGFRPYVEAIAEFLTADGTRPPITLSIEGQWGCGKSSFMKQLRKEIIKKNDAEEEPEHLTVWFNCWRYEKEDELWAAFALCLMKQLSDHLSWKQQLLAQLKLRYLRLKFNWSKDKNSKNQHFIILIIAICIFIGCIGILVSIYLYSLNKLSVTVGALVGIVVSIVYIWKEIKDVIGNPVDFSKLVSSPNYTEHISFIEYFHSDFSKIINAYAGNSRVYIFIDDLDRCEIPKAAELMQAINLMISDKANIYFTIGMDRKIISAGLAAKNEQILKYLDMEEPEHNNGLSYGYGFIEKFIQLPFKVPIPKSDDFLTFLILLEENESSMSPSKSVDKNSISKELTLDDSSEDNILNDMDCKNDSGILKLILKMVAPVLDNNPRKIKQFINQFRFQKIIGYKTGLFSYPEGTHPKDKWNCRKLAKFVAISMKWPDIISSLSVDKTLLSQLQKYSLMDAEMIKKDNELILNLESKEKWIHSKKLIELLKAGCVESEEFPLNIDEYSLSSLDFTKLLQISPIATPNWRSIHGTINDAVMAEATRKMIWERILEVKKVGYENCDCGKPIRDGYLMSYDHEGGYKVPGYAAPQWFYVHCMNCGYDTSIGKTGIRINDLNKQRG